MERTGEIPTRVFEAFGELEERVGGLVVAVTDCALQVFAFAALLGDDVDNAAHRVGAVEC